MQAHKSLKFCLILAFGVLAISGLLVFWQRPPVPLLPLPFPFLLQQQPDNRPTCQLQWDAAGNCSAPAPKSEKLCLDPPFRAQLIPNGRKMCWRSSAATLAPASPFRAWFEFFWIDNFAEFLTLWANIYKKKHTHKHKELVCKLQHTRGTNQNMTQNHQI